MIIVDYIIVGQGIAGTLLSYSLLKKNKKVLVIDDSYQSSSSIVAAGIFNPITGRRMVKTWMADTLFPFAYQTYHELEQLLNCKFYYRKNILKFFSSIRDKNDWTAKATSPELNNYVVLNNDYSMYDKMIDNSHGCVEITFSGYLDIQNLLTSYKKYLLEKSILIDKKFNYDDINITSESVKWQNYHAKKIIFCDGYKASVNPYFNWLPFVLAKGEMLTIYAKTLDVNKIINKGIYIVPISKSIFKVGSTYNWETIDTTPTKSGKEELINKLNKFLKVDYKIIDHTAGVRPTVKDRKPLIGVHPKCKALGIFNGFGTKAVTLAPFFANQFTDYLTNGKPLSEEVSITRFKD